MYNSLPLGVIAFVFVVSVFLFVSFSMLDFLELKKKNKDKTESK